MKRFAVHKKQGTVVTVDRIDRREDGRLWLTGIDSEGYELQRPLDEWEVQA